MEGQGQVWQKSPGPGPDRPLDSLALTGPEELVFIGWILMKRKNQDHKSSPNQSLGLDLQALVWAPFVVTSFSLHNVTHSLYIRT